MSEQRIQREEPVGVAFFASIMMILIGAFHAVAGLSGIAEEGFYGTSPDYLLEFSANAWGWIQIVLGILVVFAGLSLMTGVTWARQVGILVVLVSALAAFAFVPLAPVWSVVVIAADVVVIWSLAAHREAVAE